MIGSRPRLFAWAATRTRGASALTMPLHTFATIGRRLVFRWSCVLLVVGQAWADSPLSCCGTLSLGSPATIRTIGEFGRVISARASVLQNGQRQRLAGTARLAMAPSRPTGWTSAIGFTSHRCSALCQALQRSFSASRTRRSRCSAWSVRSARRRFGTARRCRLSRPAAEGQGGGPPMCCGPSEQSDWSSGCIDMTSRWRHLWLVLRHRRGPHLA
mmetsp:Transcript_75442/g.203635  ORF Transcript_75442/g.203635 Transcript_75442/m.203635 type:complete len:215 (-) Transcript_75442:47-691(-)